MKVLMNTVFRDGSDGFVRMEADDDDDMYHVYNILEEGDTLEAETVRMVTTESSTGARDKNRVHTRMMIEVEKIEYDAEQCALRVKGKNIRENEHIRMGQFHTIEIEKGRAFTITKPEWDTIRLEILRELENPMQNAEVAVLVMQEGLANLCLIRSTMTKTCAVVTRTIPKKKQGNIAYDQAIKSFFNDIYAAVLLHINFDLIKVFLVGSPGFLNEQFMTYFDERSLREEKHDLQRQEVKQKFVKVHSSTGYKGAVEEILSDVAIGERLQNVRAVKDIQCLKLFENMLINDADRACYGFQVVQYAAFQDAVDVLLITDNFCHQDFAQRKVVDQLVKHVKEHGGQVVRLSSLHSSGERLQNLTGIAAMLFYPITDIDLLAEAVAKVSVSAETT